MKSIKLVTLTASLMLAGGFLAGCTSDQEKTSESTVASTAVSSEAEVVTSASISDSPEVIANALSADGNWIVAATNDLTFDADVVVDGEFHNKGDETQDIYRKFALYTQDDDHNVTGEFTLTAPKMVVNSENFNIVHGTVKGDIEVNANGFVLNGAKVEGNITFSKAEYKESADLAMEGASVSGDVTVAE
ncbi:polymer-forming cytoskeletal protein [Vagococcus zengguangii]|uniref:Polymer-forming cytoskeletal protein n=1 Tax=Vagococcus zengguangii TaxID=2571750 RepID=A0A4D7CYS0_9ENTE|nr:polymer-forming cytoskeletal protein [Vagococcus zengguangii]QCI86990.1 polymer-forming cytoskeletal protein [Vagococcus zengguangii]TLG80968.1 polymer-forming cytoskeletal protein [Vagococcus zengguangii]